MLIDCYFEREVSMTPDSNLKAIRELELLVEESPTLDTLARLESLYKRNAMASRFSKAEDCIQKFFVDREEMDDEELVNLSPQVFLPLSRYEPSLAGHEAIISGIFRTIWDRFEKHRMALVELNVKRLETASTETADPFISAILLNDPPLPEKFADFMAKCEDTELIDHIQLRIKYWKRHSNRRQQYVNGDS